MQSKNVLTVVSWRNFGLIVPSSNKLKVKFLKGSGEIMGSNLERRCTQSKPWFDVEPVLIKKQNKTLESSWSVLLEAENTEEYSEVKSRTKLLSLSSEKTGGLSSYCKNAETELLKVLNRTPTHCAFNPVPVCDWLKDVTWPLRRAAVWFSCHVREECKLFCPASETC